MVNRNSSFLSILVVMGASLWLGGSSLAGDEDSSARWNEVHHTYLEADQAADSQHPDFAETASLDDMLAVAETQNPDLRAIFDRWEAALEQVPQAHSLPDPKFSYGYFIEPVETRVGPQRQSFGLSQTIPMFGKRGLREDVAVQAANAAGARYEASRLELRFRITQIWNDYYFLGRAIAVTEENVRLLTDFEDVALSRYAAGQAPQSVVLRAQVELGRLEDQLRSLQDQRAPYSAALNAEINRPDSALIAWPDSMTDRPVEASLDALRQALLAHNPQLAALAHLKDRDAQEAKLAGKSVFPDLTLGIDYIDTKKTSYGDFPDSGQDAVIARATINIPLWTGRLSAEKSQAAARLSASGNEYLHLRNRLLADLERAHFEMRDSERRVELYAYTLLPRARQSIDVTAAAFQAGEAGFLDLIDAQRTLLEFELAHERALADRSTRRAKLEQIVGIDLDAVPETKDKNHG